MNKILQLLIFLLMIPLIAIAFERTQVFNDPTYFLPIRDYQNVNRQLDEFQKKTGIKFYALLIDKTDGENLATYSDQIFKKWKPDLLLVICDKCKDLRLIAADNLEELFPELTVLKIVNQAKILVIQRQWKASMDSIMTNLNELAHRAAVQEKPAKKYNWYAVGSGAAVLILGLLVFLRMRRTRKQ